MNDDGPIVRPIEICSSVPSINMALLQPKNHLGRGSFGQVIKASYDGEMVAMKVLDCEGDSYKKQFLNEIEQLYSLQHPNIIKVIGRCSGTTKLAFVMELMDNGSMEDILHRHLCYTYKTDHVISWARQCADAVSFIHGKGLIHRDLKPNNLLLKNGFRVLKLCDFGTAGSLRTHMTNNLGSPSWMAPEVFMSQSYNDKCDVYSFGITLWEMVTRRRPFGADDAPYTILWKACSRPPTIYGACTNVIMDLIADCWAKEPKSRPSMRDVLEILLELTKIFPNGFDPIVLPENKPSQNKELVEAQKPSHLDTEFLDKIDPSLWPIRLGNLEEEDEGLYSEQVLTCKRLYELENSLSESIKEK
uniref:Mitogen-activated protein kinase kinase kinase n=1 Tax=Syphacia muris TaxID=451379 RepID=A0A158R3X0_9BILA